MRETWCREILPVFFYFIIENIEYIKNISSNLWQNKEFNINSILKKSEKCLRIIIWLPGVMRIWKRILMVNKYQERSNLKKDDSLSKKFENYFKIQSKNSKVISTLILTWPYYLLNKDFSSYKNVIYYLTCYMIYYANIKENLLNIYIVRNCKNFEKILLQKGNKNIDVEYKYCNVAAIAVRFSKFMPPLKVFVS